MRSVVDPAFWKGRRVLLTGHTGFKGAWAALWLSAMGAHVVGYARAPEDEALYKIAGVSVDADSTIADLADLHGLRRCVAKSRPEIVIHLAAQALVRRAARDPVDTFASNVVGTTHLLEALRDSPGLRIVLVVTTDKVYLNRNDGRAFREDDVLWGEEPYSASKVGQELVVSAYGRSHFTAAGVKLATARGGNVVGGGDFGEDRLVPDIVRAVRAGRDVAIRHPDSTRPWQHVLDCLSGYLVYIQFLWKDAECPLALNIGPSDGGSLPVSRVAATLSKALGRPDAWSVVADGGPVEAKALALDTSLARSTIGWFSGMTAEQTLADTASWYEAWLAGADMRARCLSEIAAFLNRPAQLRSVAGL